MSQSERREHFIHQLAKFLVGDVAAKSIMLEMEGHRASSDPRPALAKEWADLYHSAGMTGYRSEAEAIEKLNELLAEPTEDKHHEDPKRTTGKSRQAARRDRQAV